MDRGDDGAGSSHHPRSALAQSVLDFRSHRGAYPSEISTRAIGTHLGFDEAGWGSTVPVGSASWTAYLNEWQERRSRYSRLVEEGISPLAVSAEAATLMEENRLVKEVERHNLLTLLIDFVPVDTYGRLLEDVG